MIITVYVANFTIKRGKNRLFICNYSSCHPRERGENISGIYFTRPIRGFRPSGWHEKNIPDIFFHVSPHGSGLVSRMIRVTQVQCLFAQW